MPCIKCSNGKYKYGERGDCIFDTLAKCKAAAVAINISEPGPHGPIPQKGADMKQSIQPVQPVQPTNPMHDPMCQCAGCKGLYRKYPMK
jgi:hypothetical protein